MASASTFDTTAPYTDVDDRIELPEIDCALLAALLEESLPEVDGDDMEHVPRTAAQSPAASTVEYSCEDCGLEEMLLVDATSTSTSVSTSMINIIDVDEYSHRWLDVDVVGPSSPSDNMGDSWFMGTAGAGEVGMVEDYDIDSGDYDDQFYSYYGGDVTVDDGFSPLWH